MEAGGRTSVAAAYEAMAAKEAGPTSHGWLFFFGQKKMLGFVENVEIHGIWYDFMEFDMISWDFIQKNIGFYGILWDVYLNLWQKSQCHEPFLPIAMGSWNFNHPIARGMGMVYDIG